MASILAFAGSNSSISINLKLVKETASLIKEHEVQVLNLADYPFPMYSYDEEKNNGYINSLVEFKGYIEGSQGLILSVNEYNGEPSSYFKNLVDWLSRLDRNFLLNTKVLLMSTSGGERGAVGALETAGKLVSRFGGEVVTTFSLPSFGENFNSENGITNTELSQKHQEAIALFLSKL